MNIRGSNTSTMSLTETDGGATEQSPGPINENRYIGHSCITYEENDPNKLASCYSASDESMKSSNLVIFACKHGSIELLNYLFSTASNIVLNQKGELNFLPSAQDERGHHAFYYSMLWTEPELLDTLIEKWPTDYFTKNPEELDRLLTDAYRDLKLRNVVMSTQMVTYVENALFKLRFFNDKKTEPSKPNVRGTKKGGRVKNPNKPKQIEEKERIPEHILQRIDIVLRKIAYLQIQPVTAGMDEMYVCVVKLIAKCVHVLKRQLKVTYDRIPWEEIEFYLTVFIGSIVAPHEEINLFYGANLSKKKVLELLKHFAERLELVKSMDFQGMGALPKLKRPEMIDHVIGESSFLREFYRDYEQLRDFYSLKSISKYLSLASAADAEDKYGQLVIIRSLQVIGEHLKTSVQCPKLSTTTEQFLLRDLPSHTAEVLKNLRDSISHEHSLDMRMEIEEHASSVFIRVQNDLKKLSTAVATVDLKQKAAYVRLLLEGVLRCDNIEDIKELVGSRDVSKLDTVFFQSPARAELEALEEQVNSLKEQISSKTIYEESLFDEVDRRISNEKSMGLVQTNLFFGKCKLKDIIGYITRGYPVHVIKSKTEMALQYLSLEIGESGLKRIKHLCEEILKSVAQRDGVIDNTEDEAMNTVNKIDNILNFEIRSVNSIEQYRRLLKIPLLKRNKKASKSPTILSKLFQGKIDTLKIVLSQKFSNKQLHQNVILYERNENLQALIEMLVLDIMTILSSSGCLSDNPLFLDSDCPVLIGKNLRNHLAHENALVKVLTNTSLDAFLTASAITNADAECWTKKIDKVINTDPLRLEDACNKDIDVLRSQQTLFIALTEGDIESTRNSLRAGSELKARDINMRTVLHFATESRDLETVKFVLGRKDDMNMDSKDIQGRNVLHVAAECGSVRILEYFMSIKKMCLTYFDDDNKTPLHLAAEYGQEATVEFLLGKGACRKAKDAYGFAPLHCAVTNNHVTTSEILLNEEMGADSNEARGGFTALHAAAEYGSSEVVEMLLDRKAEVNLRCDSGRTPLHLASRRGHLRVVEQLIAKGAYVMAQCLYGNTPLHLATDIGRGDIAAVLLHGGAEVDACAQFSMRTPLHYAADTGDVEVAALLLRNGADVNATDIKLKTPLIIAARGGHYNVARLLLENGASVDVEDVNKLTALQFAAIYGGKNIVQLLIQFGADVNEGSRFGYPPLYLAAEQGRRDNCEVLLSSGADVDIKGVLNTTSLSNSALLGHLDIVDLLISHSACVNSENDLGYTPSWQAIKSGHQNVLELLVSKGACIPKEALHLASMFGYPELVKYLLNMNLDVNEYYSFATPLIFAAHQNYIEVVKLLLSMGADVHAKDSEGHSALFYAVKYNFQELTDVLTQDKGDIDFDLLLIAVSNGYDDIVDIFLEKFDFDINTPLKGDIMLLHKAVAGGHRSIVAALIEKGARVNGATKERNITPLYVAASSGHLEILTLLLSKGAETDVNTKANGGVTPLLVASSKGFDLIVEALLKAGSDPSICCQGNTSPMEAAVIRGHISVLESFFRNTNVNVNARNGSKETLLHCAASRGQLQVVKYLLEKCADQQAFDDYGCKPIHLAALFSKIEVVEYLINGRNRIDEPDVNDETPLHYAADENYAELTRFLISNNADMDALDVTGSTPIQAAARKGNEDVIRILLENGARFDTRDSSGNSPAQVASSVGIFTLLMDVSGLFDAVKRNSLPDVKSFIVIGTPVNARKNNGNNPLHYACCKGYGSIVALLLENKANVNAVNRDGMTPLHYASKFCHIEIVLMLLTNGAVYDARTSGDKTPRHLTDLASRVSELLDLVDRSFRAVVNGEAGILGELRNKSVKYVKAVLRARNKEMQSLVVVAIRHGFPWLDELEVLLQDDIIGLYMYAKENLSRNIPKSFAILTVTLYRRLEVFGPDDPCTLEVRMHIGNLLVEQNKYDEALSHFHDIYLKRKNAVGENLRTLQMKHNIALVLCLQEKKDESLKVIEELIQNCKQMHNANDVLLLKAKAHKIRLLMKMEEYNEALKISREIVEPMGSVLGVFDSLYLTSLDNHATILVNLDNYDEALETFQEVYETRTKVLGTNHESTLDNLIQIANVFSLQRKYEDALEKYKAILLSLQSSMCQNRGKILFLQYLIGSTLCCLGSYLEAFKIFNDIIGPITSFFGCSSPRVSRIRNKMKQIEMKYEFVFQDGKNILSRNEVVEGDGYGGLNFENLQEQTLEDLKRRDSEGRTALHHFVHSGDEKSVRFLLQKGVDVFQMSNKGNTPLHTAALRGLEGMARILLQHVKKTRPDRLHDFINARTCSRGNTALHASSSVGVTRLLLQYGAWYDVPNESGETPEDVCNDNDSRDLLRLVDGCFKLTEQADLESVVGRLEGQSDHNALAARCARNKEGCNLFAYLQERIVQAQSMPEIEKDSIYLLIYEK